MLEQLTKKELEVLKLISESLTNKEIMNKLCITHYTLKSHIQNIYSKFGIFRESAQGAMRVRAVLIYLKEKGSKNI